MANMLMGLGVSAGSQILTGLIGRAQAKATQKVANAQAKLQTETQYNTDLRSQSMALANLTASNEAVITANRGNSVRANIKAALLLQQKAQVARNMASQNQQLGQGRLTALGMVDANAAAAGNIGNSVDAVVADVQFKVGEALTRSREDWEIQALNFQTQQQDLNWWLEDNTLATQDASLVPEAVRGNTYLQNNVPSVGTIIATSLASTALGYANAKMSLGNK